LLLDAPDFGRDGSKLSLKRVPLMVSGGRLIYQSRFRGGGKTFFDRTDSRSPADTSSRTGMESRKSRRVVSKNEAEGKKGQVIYGSVT